MEKFKVEDYRTTRLVLEELRKEGHLSLDECVKLRGVCSNKMDKISFERQTKKVNQVQ